MIKICKKCGTPREIYTKCKPCKKIAHAKWVKENPEKKKANGTRWRLANPEKVKESKSKFHAKNPEKAKVYAAKWYAENAIQACASQKKYRERNPEKQKAKTAKYESENPDAKRIRKHNRRTRERANGGKLSKDIAIKLLNLQQGKCACCRIHLEKYHLDHRMPLVLGGSNTDDNIQLLCPNCNLQKHVKHPVDFMQSRGYLL